MKKFVRKIINLLGYEIKKKRKNFFLKNKIDLIIDVGAHRGEFAFNILNENFQGKIISFEPQSQIYKALLKNSIKFNNWHVHERCGIGKTNKNLILNIMNETTCSSFFVPTKNLLSIDPNAKIIKKEKTKIFSLNNLFSKNYKIKKKTFLKIDTQGYDRFVIDGASKILKKILYVQMELAIEPLYKNETKYERMIQYMEKRGFIIWNLGGVIENLEGKSMSFDIIFKNNNF